MLPTQIYLSVAKRQCWLKYSVAKARRTLGVEASVSSAVSAAIQNSTALSCVRSLCRSAARPNRRCLASKTSDAWSRADPIVDA